MSAHHDIDAELIAAVAARASVHTLNVKKTLLGLPVSDGSEERIVAALLDAGVDEGFLLRLRGLPRAPTSTSGPA